MITDLPHSLNTAFLLVCVFTLFMFYFANGKPKAIMFILMIWSILHSYLAYYGFYEIMNTIPPRFTLIMLPITLAIIYACLPKQIERLESKRNRTASTFLHTVRIPVEIILFYLFCHKMIPELMTFEGRNFDILAGISALIIAYFLMKKKISNKALLFWNIIGLFLVLFILVNALLSAELPFQLFAFDQPNRAVQYFPFVLLPALVVPIVVYMHISDIILLRRQMRSE